MSIQNTTSSNHSYNYAKRGPLEFKQIFKNARYLVSLLSNNIYSHETQFVDSIKGPINYENIFSESIRN